MQPLIEMSQHTILIASEARRLRSYTFLFFVCVSITMIKKLHVMRGSKGGGGKWWTGGPDCKNTKIYVFLAGPDPLKYHKATSSIQCWAIIGVSLAGR